MYKYCNILLFSFFLISLVMASNFSLDYDSVSGTTVIWIEVEDYDRKTPEFVVDKEVFNASGSAMCFQQYSDQNHTDEWWAGYSIDSSDIANLNVNLSGTWYCCVRVSQPVAGVEQADYLIVKGDSGDGIGTDWYSTAFSTIDDTDDILNDDIVGNDGIGYGAWIWMGANDKAKGVEKESNENSARIDTICWADDPYYIPNDASFGKVVVSDGLVLGLMQLMLAKMY